MGKQEMLLENLFCCLLGIPRNPRDWAPLISLASETLTIGTLADAVLTDSFGARLPDNVRALLVDVLDRARRRNARLTSQFSEFLPVLNAAGIEPIIMRGIARLVSSPNEDARLLSDIDFLVPAEQRGDCAEALIGLGYRIQMGVDCQPLPLVFGRTRDVGMVDVHTILQPFYLQLEFERIAPDCRRIELGNGKALLPSPTCQLLFIVVHDQLHDGDYWRGLIDMRHMIDIAHLVEEGIDWEHLASFFRSACASNALHVQLRTARSLLKIDIPEEYCGGNWAALQLIRRRLQAQFPFLMSFFTLLSIAIEPPPRSRTGTQFASAPGEPLWRLLPRIISEYLRPANKGKLWIPS